MIETPRLILRPPEEKDIESIYKAINDMWPELQLWMSWSQKGANSMEAVRHYVLVTCEEDRAKGGLTLFGFHRKTGDFVVATGLTYLENRPQEFCTGYWVSKGFLGQGYALEGANASIRYGFEKKNAVKLHTEYYEGNYKSKRIIDSLGFTFTKTDPNGHVRFSDNCPVDVHHYEMEDPAVLPPLEMRVIK